jgi:hypothetical protein
MNRQNSFVVKPKKQGYPTNSSSGRVRRLPILCDAKLGRSLALPLFFKQTGFVGFVHIVMEQLAVGEYDDLS